MLLAPRETHTLRLATPKAAHSQSNTGHLIGNVLATVQATRKPEVQKLPSICTYYGCQTVYGIKLDTIKDHSARLTPRVTNYAQANP